MINTIIYVILFSIVLLLSKKIYTISKQYKELKTELIQSLNVINNNFNYLEKLNNEIKILKNLVEYDFNRVNKLDESIREQIPKINNKQYRDVMDQELNKYPFEK